MRGLTKKTSALFFLGGLAGLVLAAVITLIWYVEHVRSTLVSLEEEVAVLILREKQANSIEHFLDDIASEEVMVGSFFIHRDNVVNAIETFESLGSIVGGTVSLAQVDVIGQTKEVPGVLSFRLSASGSWSAMMHLLALLEHLPFHAKNSQVSLATGSSASDGPAVWSLQAVVTAALVQ